MILTGRYRKLKAQLSNKQNNNNSIEISILEANLTYPYPFLLKV